MFFFSIYNKFKFRKWEHLSPAKRQRVLEKVEQKQAKKLNRTPLPVIMQTDASWNCYGMFAVENGKQLLYLNIRLITEPHLRFHALETIMHEGRHAYQYKLASSTDIGLLNFRARKWKQNYSGYISSYEDKLFYSMQPIERDAQKYAIKQLSYMKFRFGDEEDYKNTLNSMIYRYEQTVKQLKEEQGFFFKQKMYKKIRQKNQK
jgi:hypothetical protein